MRLNYFLRGLGVGIVITTLILTISHSANRKMSDNEIIERARELGMTFETQPESASKEETTSAIETTERETTQSDTSQPETTQEQTTQGETTQSETTQPETTKEQTTQGETTQPETTQPETTQEQTTQEESSQENTTAQNGDVITYTLTVERGMSSNVVCRLLNENGIIDNAADFDNYLVSKGYAEKIRVGSFEVRSDMSYEELAATFCSK
ncbi:MAG: hypothetical protein ACI4R6_03810 [Lachnospiraceae bacterium]